MWSCSVTTIEHEREECANRQCCERDAWCVPALNNYCVTSFSHPSLGLGWEAIMQTVLYVRNTLRNRLVVWFTAILTYLPVLPFHIIIGSNVRFYAHDLDRADVGL